MALLGISVTLLILCLVKINLLHVLGIYSFTLVFFVAFDS